MSLLVVVKLAVIDPGFGHCEAIGSPFR